MTFSAIIVLTTFRFNAVVTLALWQFAILVKKGKKRVSIGAFIPIGVDILVVTSLQATF